MAEEPGVLEGLGKIIPSIYYDLIARVCAGVPFLTVLLWDQRSKFGDITWAKLTLLLGAGYVVGLVLTPLSLPWGLIQLVVRRVLKMPIKFREGASLTDQIAAKDKEAGATLAKMQAEAILVENLFSAFIVLTLWSSAYPLELIAKCTRGSTFLILVLLGISVLHRITAYVIRENRLYHVYCGEYATSPAAS